MQLRRTKEFNEWLRDLRDKQGKAKIVVRLDRLEEGNPGNSRSVGEGVFELKVDFGPGYRVYYVQRGRSVDHSTLRGRQKHSEQRYSTSQGYRQPTCGDGE